MRLKVAQVKHNASACEFLQIPTVNKEEEKILAITNTNFRLIHKTNSPTCRFPQNFKMFTNMQYR